MRPSQGGWRRARRSGDTPVPLAEQVSLYGNGRDNSPIVPDVSGCPRLATLASNAAMAMPQCRHNDLGSPKPERIKTAFARNAPPDFTRHGQRRVPGRILISPCELADCRQRLEPGVRGEL
jgi:hypothetical protein